MSPQPLPPPRVTGTWGPPARGFVRVSEPRPLSGKGGSRRNSFSTELRASRGPSSSPAREPGPRAPAGHSAHGDRGSETGRARGGGQPLPRPGGLRAPSGPEVKTDVSTQQCCGEVSCGVLSVFFGLKVMNLAFGFYRKPASSCAGQMPGSALSRARCSPDVTVPVNLLQDSRPSFK